MKPRFLALLLLITLISSYSFALDYKITSVIEVGETANVQMLGPLKWSPDGAKLAFFRHGVLKVTDTLGNVSEVAKLDISQNRYDWVSSNQIALQLRASSGQPMNTDERLILIDISSGVTRIIHEFKTSPGYREIPGKTTSSGPYETVEGNKFYLFTTYKAEGGKTVVERRSFLDNKAETLKNNHILRWGADGLYKVRLDETDSVWLANKPFQYMGAKQAISTDFSFAMDGGQLFNLRDSSIIVLDTLIGTPPPSTYACGIIWFSFNPVANEVVFTITCDDGHNYIVDRIATFDCETLELSIIDSLIGIENCAAPSFSPDGRRIAFIANNKAFILTRQFR